MRIGSVLDRYVILMWMNAHSNIWYGQFINKLGGPCPFPKKTEMDSAIVIFRMAKIVLF